MAHFSLQGSYSFTGQVGESADIRYEYSATDEVVGSVHVGYIYEDGISDPDLAAVPINGVAPATQQIMNNLPAWMIMRQDKDSVGQSLMHSWGYNLEEMTRRYDQYRKDHFVSTANQYDDVDASISELVSRNDKIYSPRLNNLIYNSAFSIKAASRFQKPEGWGVSRSDIDAVSLSKNNTLFGAYSLKLDGTKGTVTLTQTRQAILPSGSFTYSIYVKTNDTGLSTSDKWQEDEAGIVLTIQNTDNTITNYGIGFPKNTQGSWARVSITANSPKEIYKYSVHIINRIEYKFFVDLPLLEQSRSAGDWSPSLLDVPSYGDSSFRAVDGIQVLFNTRDGQSTEKIELLPVSSEDEFKYISVPTRIERYYPKEDPLQFVSNGFGREITYFDFSEPTQWEISSDKLLKKGVDTPEEYATYTPVDTIIDQEGSPWLDIGLLNSGSVLVKAVTIVDDTFYVITKETYLNKTGYYIKFVKPYIANRSIEYLQALSDLPLDLKLGKKYGIGHKSEDINRIGICKNLPGVIYVDTNLDRRFYYRLFYDYYYPDFSRRKFYCRYNYVADSGILQVV
jgi:hypothetical protein